MPEQRDDAEYGSTGFIVAWTALIIFGLIVEFFGRFFGYANNPLATFHPVISAFAGILAALIILAGCLILMSGRAKQSSLTRRRSILLITMGGIMLVGFFIFKQVIPFIFG
jgi:uncharacterized membrane protein